MSTRRAQSDAEFSEERFASSAEIERGLIGSMVARRCAVLESPKDKELIWFIHFLSWKIGLKAVSDALLANYPEAIGTPAMVKLGKSPAQKFSADEVKKIRAEIPDDDIKGRFLLKGETHALFDSFARQSEHLRSNALAALRRANELEDRSFGELERLDREADAKKSEANNRPNNYPVKDFIGVCMESAKNDLEKDIQRLCLDPAFLLNGQPWYFAGVADALRRYQEDWTANRAEGMVVTAVGKEVEETLEYTAYCRGLTLMEGNARIGKSFAARSWCEIHPGQARFVEVPTGNDDTGFFRALARGLGIGNFAQYKAVEIRERVESVLLTGDLVLVLDEAHRLWPQQIERRYGYPKRINWLMSMANQGVPISCVSTPQFLDELKAKQKNGWNSSQLQGRLKQYKPLPAELSFEDLIAVAEVQLPEADAKTLRSIAQYARRSARYLAAIETISTRARFIAQRAGREIAEATDVRRAMEESVIPSDSSLLAALEGKRPVPLRVRDIATTSTEPLPLAGSGDAVPVPSGGTTTPSLSHSGPHGLPHSLTH